MQMQSGLARAASCRPQRRPGPPISMPTWAKFGPNHHQPLIFIQWRRAGRLQTLSLGRARARERRGVAAASTGGAAHEPPLLAQRLRRRGLLFSHRSLLPSTVVPQAAATATAILFSRCLTTVAPQAAATATAGCQATATAGSRAAAAGSRAAATGSRAAATGSRAVATRSPPPRRRHPSLFEFLAPPPSPYYECQGDGTPYLG
jgi:hypothetical protein